jgi:hypothetical protein
MGVRPALSDGFELVAGAEIQERRIKRGNDALVLSLSRRQHPLFLGRQAPLANAVLLHFAPRLIPRQHAVGRSGTLCVARCWYLGGGDLVP